MLLSASSPDLLPIKDPVCGAGLVWLDWTRVIPVISIEIRLRLEYLIKGLWPVIG